MIQNPKKSELLMVITELVITALHGPGSPMAWPITGKAGLKNFF